MIRELIVCWLLIKNNLGQREETTIISQEVKPRPNTPPKQPNGSNIKDQGNGLGPSTPRRDDSDKNSNTTSAVSDSSKIPTTSINVTTLTTLGTYASTDSSSETTAPTTGYTSADTTNTNLVPEKWELNFKINKSFTSCMANGSSEEHRNLTEYLNIPMNKSCHEVLGGSFLGFDGPFRFSNGSVAVYSTLLVLPNDSNINNSTLWEDRLGSNLNDFIQNSSATIRTKEWPLHFKIAKTFTSDLENESSAEHRNLSEFLYNPIIRSCKEVLGSSFLNIIGPFRFSNGSVAVVANLLVLPDNPNLDNSALWEDSLSSTLPGLFIRNLTSTNVTNVTHPPSVQETNAALIGGICGGVFAVLVLVIAVIVCRVGIKPTKKQQPQKVEEVMTRKTQGSSFSLPDSTQRLTWRKSYDTENIGEAWDSQRQRQEKSDGSQQASLHRRGIDKTQVILDDILLPASVAAKTKDISNAILANEPARSESSIQGKLQRFYITETTAQEDFGTVTTSDLNSTNRSLQVLVNNHSKNNSKYNQKSGVVDIPPADFGGLFVPESASQAGNASSFGSRLNRMYINRPDQETKDIDPSSLSNAGELLSMKPPNSDANMNILIKESVPLRLKLHRETSPT